MKLNGKKAIITGGNQGIGKGIALAFARQGAELVIQYRSAEDKAQQVLKQIETAGGKATLFKSDFSIAAQPENFFGQAIAEMGSADILVNCAAAYARGAFLEVSNDDFMLMQKVNVEVPFRLIRLFAEHRIAQGGNGSIINISSISGLMPSVGSSLNSCSKAGLNMLTRCAALELASHKIRVNGIAPGLIETESNQKAMQDSVNWKKTVAEQIPIARAGVPADVANLAVMLAADDASFVTGTTIPCDGGMTISWM